MQLETFTYSSKRGWSTSEFPNLDSAQTLILVFASPEIANDPSPLNDLSAKYPTSTIIGCSGSGEISGGEIIDGGMSVAVAKFDKTPFKAMQLELSESYDSRAVGEQISAHLDQKDLKGIFVLSEGLSVNGTHLVQGLNSASNDDVVITGGLAGDGDRFEKTFTIYKGKITTNSVVAVGFYGNSIKIGHSSRGGWDIFGPERKVTRATNNVLYELDDQPALQLYREYLGDRASGLPATGLLFPLSIRQDSASNDPAVRTILAINEKDQSLTFAGDMQVGYLAQLMRANFDRLIESASNTGQEAVKQMDANGHNNGPILAVAVSCVGRRLLLGERAEEEVELTLGNMPKNAKQVGFYSYGELSPFASGDCGLHNQTMTMTTFYEE